MKIARWTALTKVFALVLVWLSFNKELHGIGRLLFVFSWTSSSSSSSGPFFCWFQVPKAIRMLVHRLVYPGKIRIFGRMTWQCIPEMSCLVMPMEFPGNLVAWKVVWQCEIYYRYIPCSEDVGSSGLFSQVNRPSNFQPIDWHRPSNPLIGDMADFFQGTPHEAATGCQFFHFKDLTIVFLCSESRCLWKADQPIRFSVLWRGISTADSPHRLEHCHVTTDNSSDSSNVFFRWHPKRPLMKYTLSSWTSMLGILAHCAWWLVLIIGFSRFASVWRSSECIQNSTWRVAVVGFWPLFKGCLSRLVFPARAFGRGLFETLGSLHCFFLRDCSESIFQFFNCGQASLIRSTNWLWSSWSLFGLCFTLSSIQDLTAISWCFPWFSSTRELS